MAALPTPEQEFLAWFRHAVRGLTPPTGPRSELPKWFARRTPAELRQADEALLHWLATWEWLHLTEATRGILYLRMSFAWSWLVEGLETGWAVPHGDAGRRGVIYGLVFREWEQHRGSWIERFATTSKTDGEGNFVN